MFMCFAVGGGAESAERECACGVGVVMENVWKMEDGAKWLCS